MTGSRSAVERAVKIDVAADRRIALLAYFMDMPKKAVVREAIAEYAEARLSRAAGGAVGGEVASGASAMMFEDLPIRDRLALSRGRLIREFADRGGTGVRVMIESTESRGDVIDDEWGGDRPDTVELLVDTRLEDGSGAVVVLAGIARSILREPVTVTSLTAVRLYRPERIDDLMARSRPL